MSARARCALLLLALLVCCGSAPARSWAANNCAAGGGPRPDDGGIGGTGARPGDGDEDDSGVGGTGVAPHSPNDDDSGIGGTGISADTGVIGTITGFASICVGGVEIHYDAASRVQVDDQPATTAALAVGQVVEVLAGGSGTELAARQITVRHVVTGPVTAVAADRNELEVMGQTVRLSSTTRGDAEDDQAISAGTVAVGTVVRVSGARQDDGSIVASRVTRSVDDVARLSGRVDASSPDAAIVAGTPVRVGGGTTLAVGDEVRLAGRWDGAQLVASSSERIAAVPFEGRAARVEVEGFASLASSGELRVGPYRFDVSPAAIDALAGFERNAPVNIEAVVRENRAVVERVRLAPELPPRPPSREGRAGNLNDAGREPSDHSGPDDRGHPPPRDGRGGRPEGAPRDARVGPPERPERPDRPERPSGPDRPERPPRVDRPPLPDRPDLPPRPERPPRPGPH